MRDYLLIRPLSEGGVAEVHLAQRRGAQTFCVLKRLKVSMMTHALAKKRLVREAQLASQLTHPNVAQVLDAGFEDGDFYIAMELIRGHDLSEVFQAARARGARLPPELSLGIIQKVLLGLDYAHNFTDAEGNRLDIVHRDLSARNVMISYEGEVKVIDFGVAKTNAKEALTASGVLLGTPKYMSPEQALGERVDARSDLYSLSVIFYELLTGHHVVDANQQLLDALRAVVTEMPKPLLKLAPEAPAKLEAVIMKGLDKTRELRWPNAKEYLRALTEAMGTPTDVEGRLRAVLEELFEEEKQASALFFQEQITTAPEPSEEVVYAPTWGAPEVSPEVRALLEAPTEHEPTDLTKIAGYEQALAAMAPTMAAPAMGILGSPQTSSPARGVPAWLVAVLSSLATALIMSAVAVYILSSRAPSRGLKQIQDPAGAPELGSPTPVAKPLVSAVSKDVGQVVRSKPAIKRSGKKAAPKPAPARSPLRRKIEAFVNDQNRSAEGFGPLFQALKKKVRKLPKGPSRKNIERRLDRLGLTLEPLGLLEVLEMLESAQN